VGSQALRDNELARGGPSGGAVSPCRNGEWYRISCRFSCRLPARPGADAAALPVPAVRLLPDDQPPSPAAVAPGGAVGQPHPPVANRCPHLAVPDQIVIAFVAKLKLYGFWRVEGLFPELLRVLENDGATGL